MAKGVGRTVILCLKMQCCMIEYKNCNIGSTSKYHAVYGCYLLEPPIVHKSLLYEITNTEESLELNCTILHKTSPNVIQESLTEKCQKAQSHKWLSNLTSIGSWFL